MMLPREHMAQSTGPQMVVIRVSEAKVLLLSIHASGSACHLFLRLFFVVVVQFCLMLFFFI